MYHGISMEIHIPCIWRSSMVFAWYSLKNHVNTIVNPLKTTMIVSDGNTMVFWSILNGTKIYVPRYFYGNPRYFEVYHGTTMTHEYGNRVLKYSINTFFWTWYHDYTMFFEMQHGISMVFFEESCKYRSKPFKNFFAV